MTQTVENNPAILRPAPPGIDEQLPRISSPRIISRSICAFMLLIVVAEFFFLRHQPRPDYRSAVLLMNLVLFTLVAVYDLSLGFNIAIMLLPFDAILPSYKVAGLVSIELYVEAILVLAAVGVLKVFLGQLKYRPVLLDITIFVFALLALTFLFTSGDIHRSGYTYFNVVFVPTLTYGIARLVLSDETRYASFKSRFLFSITIAAAVVIVLFMLTGERVDAFRGLESGILFILASFLLLGYGRKRFLALAVINLAAMVFCFPRGLLLCVLCSPIFYLIVKKGFGRIFFLAIMVLSLLGTILLQSFVTDSDYRESLRRFNREHGYSSILAGAVEKSAARITDIEHIKLSIYGRVNLWQADIANFYNHPLLGAGLGITNTQTVDCHNVHVQLLSAVGILGYLVFHLLLFQSLCHKNTQAHGMLRWDLISYSVIVCVIYINGTTNGLLHGCFNHILFPIMALIQNLERIGQSNETSAA